VNRFGPPAAALLVALAVSAAPLAAQSRPEWREWNRPVEPFRIADGLWYVGAKDIAAYLFTTPEGHVLLDGGFPETAPTLLANLAKLGFRIEDVRFLLNSHAHFDHAGGLAELRRRSGAILVVSEGDAAVVERGGLGDFALGDDAPFPAVEVGHRIRDGETVELGGLALTAHVTAGHTRGCTTWTGRFRDRGRALDAVFACSTSVPSPELYRLADNPAYPEIADDYRRSFATLEALPVDLFLAAHGAFFDLEAKRARLAADPDGPNPFVDPEGYRRYVERSKRRFEELLAEAEAKRPSAPPSNRSSP